MARARRGRPPAPLRRRAGRVASWSVIVLGAVVALGAVVLGALVGLPGMSAFLLTGALLVVLVILGGLTRR